MHDRLAEMNQAVPGQRISQKPSLAGEEEEVDGGVAMKLDVLTEDQEVMAEQGMLLEPNQPDFDFRLSMLPIWARKAALSRPSVAQHAASRGMHSPVSAGHMASIGSRLAEGRWAEVQLPWSITMLSMTYTLQRLTNSELTFASEIETDSLMGMVITV